MSDLAKANIAIAVLAAATVTFAALFFVTNREFGICVHLLDPNVSAVPL